MDKRTSAFYEKEKQTFAERLLEKAFPDKAFRALPIEAFAEIDYQEELTIKNEALADFWKAHKVEGKPEPIIPSPKPRFYRASTKRRVVVSRKGASLSFIGGNADTKSNNKRHESVLEPESHKAIYQFISEKLNEPAYQKLARHLNFVVVRGSYDEPSVIFNIDLMNGELVRKLKLLSEHLQALPHNIVSAYIFQDATRSTYTFEQKRPDVQVPFKRLFGAERLFLKVLGKKFSYHPTAFSQINESMLPVMLQQAEQFLSSNGTRLLDLYCGYGLFGLFLSEKFEEVIGVDSGGASIDSAKENALYFKKAKLNFLARRITAESLARSLPPSVEGEAILLDPPRQGTERNVVETLAQRNPKRVLHIFCGVDEIPREIKAWNLNGYKIERVVPIDMFAGTANLEMMILLKPKA